MNAIRRTRPASGRPARRSTRRGARLIAVLASMLALVFTTVSTPSATALPAWRDTGASWNNPVDGTTRVVGLRYATHPHFDRVVIDLRGIIPDWSTNYQRIFRYEGSGALVPIRGASGLNLTMMAAGHTYSGRNVYTGPRIARPGFVTLKALALTGDFEGYVNFGFALRHRASYRIFALHSPQRLVIDFRH
ncbi:MULTISPECIES: hypothetical protein [unclassified Nocardioides]|uniref:AMIN-like domain-containing (lipo)protein n=1 Tax=unclassified Nocardioides TaxID=2615069 RepID=UPI0006F7789A|nr:MULTISPECIES: hypothetical protein [unclassified Nocardioides]KQY51672.1 hypothetical protein ASD30_20115 [Nocardioides sp. Root140]KQZ70736.1 hypothetical protein ASD66_14275 [Nocardioides sp. Root151]KRF10926.1 hypothetical protein ASH02_18975 [Nocardioides sp. Soil796]